MNTKTKAVLAFVTIFLLGAASGYLLRDSGILHSRDYPDFRENRMGSPHSHTDPEERGEHEERIREWLTERFDLEESQQEPFFEKVREYRNELHNIMKEQKESGHEAFKTRYRALRLEMEALLDSTQLHQLDSDLHPDSVMVKQNRRWNRQKNSN